MKGPVSDAEAKVIRKQLDDVTAVAAQNGTRKATGAPGTPAPTLTEAQAREKGITPEQQNNFFSYKIRELESRVQLGEFSLTSNEMNATQKAAMTKELVVWKKELEGLTKVKAQIPKS
jgi:hypothetical protein